MKVNYVSLSITEWIGSYGTRYACLLFVSDGRNGETREISVDEARVLQWDLIRRGATKICDYNPYKPHIYVRDIRLIEIT